MDAFIAQEEAIEDRNAAWLASLPENTRWLMQAGGLIRASEEFGFDHRPHKQLWVDERGLAALSEPVRDVVGLPPRPSKAAGEIQRVRLRGPSSPLGLPRDTIDALPKADREAYLAAEPYSVPPFNAYQGLAVRWTSPTTPENRAGRQAHHRLLGEWLLATFTALAAALASIC